MYCAEKDVHVFICQLLTLAGDDEEPNSCSRIFMMFLKGAMSKQRLNLWLQRTTAFAEYFIVSKQTELDLVYSDFSFSLTWIKYISQKSHF